MAVDLPTEVGRTAYKTVSHKPTIVALKPHFPDCRFDQYNTLNCLFVPLSLIEGREDVDEPPLTAAPSLSETTTIARGIHMRAPLFEAKVH